MSDCGLVRPENQDHLLVNRRALVFCVADGMGGGQGGSEASAAVCRCLADALRRRIGFGACARRVDAAIHQADQEVRAYATKAGFSQMGSTATVLAVDGESGRRAIVGNVGDGRVYRLRDGELRQLTNDHTVSSEMHRTVMPSSVRPFFDLRAAALSHVLTRAVGAGSRVEWRKVDVREGDVFLVCSDGVHGVVPPVSLRGALSCGRAKEAVSRLRALVLGGGAPDNFSAIVVRIGGRV